MKIIVLILGLGLISYVAYYSLTHTTTKTVVVDANGNVTETTAQVQPQQQLDNVKQAAKAMEAEQQRRLDRAAAASGGQTE